MRPALSACILVLIVAACGRALPADEVYSGTYEGGSGAGDLTITITGDPAAAKRPATLLSTFDNDSDGTAEEYPYTGSFGPVGADGAITGEATVDDEPWTITGTIKDGVFTGKYVKSDESDEGTFSLKLKPAGAAAGGGQAAGAGEAKSAE